MCGRSCTPRILGRTLPLRKRIQILSGDKLHRVSLPTGFAIWLLLERWCTCGRVLEVKRTLLLLHGKGLGGHGALRQLGLGDVRHTLEVVVTRLQEDSDVRRSI